MLPGPQPPACRVLEPYPLPHRVPDPSNDRRTHPHIPDPPRVFLRSSMGPYPAPSCRPHLLLLRVNGTIGGLRWSWSKLHKPGTDIALNQHKVSPLQARRGPCVGFGNLPSRTWVVVQGEGLKKGHSMRQTRIEEPNTPEALYLDLLKKCLTRYVFGEPFQVIGSPGRIPWWPLSAKIKWGLYARIQKWLSSRQVALVYRMPFDPDRRAVGRDWPLEAETMIGLKRLDNLQYCITDVLHQGVPGDLIETGVWRGGATIVLRGVLKIYVDTQRRG